MITSLLLIMRAILVIIDFFQSQNAQVCANHRIVIPFSGMLAYGRASGLQDLRTRDTRYANTERFPASSVVV
jgi:hypothetical protein